mmetsp:Transcript_58574/g.136846  ORF Transcript_58574/g.136846 Transcript_58574/m.136846 type:complete len:133 (+) Transcript_58574:113-511(+)
MSLRGAISRSLRRLSSKPAPLGMSSPSALQAQVGKAVSEVTSFSPATFFEEKYFWQKANLGPFFLLLLFSPAIYRSLKDFYWAGTLRKLNTEEVIADRYEWLRLAMLKDEVEAALLAQPVPAPLELGPSVPP